MYVSIYEAIYHTHIWKRESDPTAKYLSLFYANHHLL